MRVAISIDAMGGDRAPREVVRGAVRAAMELPDVDLHLVGLEDAVRAELEELDWTGDNISVVPAREVIGMGDSPVEALKKKRGSSIEEAVKLVRSGDAHAFVSAGNTGACVAAAHLFLRLLAGVKRAGILVTTNVGERPLCIVDVGANVAPKADHMAQYGVMGSLFSERVLGIEGPGVGLLNIGEEDGKGNELVKATRGLLETAPVRFVGYVEGDEVYHGSADVVVCDGFTGNAILKVSEGLAERLTLLIREALQGAAREVAASAVSEGAGSGSSGGGSPAIGEIIQQVLGRSLGGLRSRLDYSEYGGAPLLGVDGSVIIAHGRSDANAIFNAIRVARRMVESEINARITERLMS